jgi:hypothetical protein
VLNRIVQTSKIAMFAFKFSWIALALTIFLSPSVRGQIVINELMAENISTLTDSYGNFSDWVEVYNGTRQDIDLSGYYVSDDSYDLTKHRLPTSGSLIISPGDFLLLWANGEENGSRNLPFKLNANEEEFVLTQPDGQTVTDFVQFAKLISDVSYGRTTDAASGDLVYFSGGTPDLSNNAEPSFVGFAPAPQISHESGFYGSNFSLNLSGLAPDEEVYYTLDGSEPDPSNLGGTDYRFLNQYKTSSSDGSGALRFKTFKTNLFVGPITVSDQSAEDNAISAINTTYSNDPDYLPDFPVKKAFVVKAKVFKTGYLPGKTVSRVFFFDNHRTALPVVSLQVSPDEFYEYESGINIAGKDFTDWRYLNLDKPADGNSEANYRRKTELGIHFDYLEGEQVVVSQKIGLKIHGGWSRALEQKAFRLYARDEYGKDYIGHRFFKNSELQRYERILLRSSGNESRGSFMKDASVHLISQGLNLETQSYKPAIQYINGEYWGLVNLRTQIDDHHFALKYDLPNEDFEYGKSHKINNSSGDYEDLRYFIMKSGTRDEEDYELIKSKIDIENFIDYTIIECFFGNTDWIINNVGFWRYRGDETVPNTELDGRWRWFLYDLDYSYCENWFFERIYNNNGSYFFKKLLAIDEFKIQFQNRLCDILNTHFIPERTVAVIDSMEQIIAPEIDGKIERWKAPKSYESWEDRIEYFRTFLQGRVSDVIEDVESHLSLSGTYELELNINSLAGFLTLNSIDINSTTSGIKENTYPWSGIYYMNSPIKITQNVKTGYLFKHWLVNEEVILDDTLEITPNSSTHVMAVFEEDFYSLNPFPVPLSLDSCDFQLYKWNDDRIAGEFLGHSAFVFMDTEDPVIDSEIAGFTGGSYNKSSKTRVSGLGNDGFSIINTGSGNTGYPAKRLGGFLLAVSLDGHEDVRLSFKIKTIKANARKYGIALKYRVGDKLPFEYFKNSQGERVQYIGESVDGDETVFTDLKINESVKNADYIQLFWQYFFTGAETSGPRDELAIDDIRLRTFENVSSSVDPLLHTNASFIEVSSVVNENKKLTAYKHIILKPGFSTSNSNWLEAKILNCHND